MISPRRKVPRPFRYLQELTTTDFGFSGDRSSGNEFKYDPLLHPKLLGIYGPEEIQEAMERYGLQSTLDSLGIGQCIIKLDTRDKSRQMTRFLSADDELVAEIIVSECRFKPREAIQDIFPGEMDFLVLQWLCLQNPRQKFTQSRLPLPGQVHPGLGVGLNVMEMILAMAARLEVCGIVNRPEFLHNAFLYEPYFLFLHPTVQGKYDALMRDTAGLSFLERAWAGYTGCIIDEEGARRFTWYQSEQLRSQCDEIDDYFASQAYMELRADAAEAARFEIDEARLGTVLDELNQRTLSAETGEQK